MQLNKLVILMGAMFAVGAQAAPSVHNAGEFYVGGKVGASLFGEPCGSQSESCEDLSGAGGLYGGYQLLDWLAVEGGYDYFGGPVATYRAIGQPNSNVDYEAEIQGLEVGLKADYGLTDRFLFFGKGGTVYWGVDKEAFEPVAGAVDESESGLSLMLGAGMEYRLSHNLSTRLEYDYINGVGGASTGESDVHFIGVGLDYRFGSHRSEPTLSPPPVETVTKQVETSPEPEVVVEPQIIETFTQVLSSSSSEALFETGSTALSPVLKSQLLPILERLKRYPESTVEITGHTDSLGAANFNQALSEARAQSVADYLEYRGVERHRMRVKGLGELRPIASNETASGRAHNRRVEIVSPEVTTQTTNKQ